MAADVLYDWRLAHAVAAGSIMNVRTAIWHGPARAAALVIALFAAQVDTPAAKMDSSPWTIAQLNLALQPPAAIWFIDNPTNVPTPPPPANPVNLALELTDNNPSTALVLSNSPALFISLGQTCVVHRVYLVGTGRQTNLWPNNYYNRTNPPLGLVTVSVGFDPASMKQVGEFTIPYDAGNPIDTEMDIRFSPVAGTQLRLDLKTNVTWGIDHWPGYALPTQPPPSGVSSLVAGEIEIYGFTGPGALMNENAVVVDTAAAAPLQLAAGDLSYYLGELTGKPHPIIAPSQTNFYAGRIYRIMDLKSLAPDYATMTNNIALGLLPENVNIEVSGREILFKAWPYRCVLWSAWEFLERQGVRWVYPDPHGDFVPVGQGFRLDFLPLRFTPSAKSIYANFDAGTLQPWPSGMRQSLRQGYLYQWRNRWNYTWGDSYGPLGGQEIPKLPAPAVTLNSDYTEAFDGYPHNFNGVVPNRILQQHTNWWGYNPSLGTRVNPTNSGATALCMNNPEVIAWVANKMKAVAQAYPFNSKSPLNLAHFKRSYNLLPNDATTYCQCPEFCLPANAPSQPSGDAWIKLFSQSFSGMYYSFVSQVATSINQQGSDAIVGALAYADVYQPPANTPALPNNVQVEVCLYGAPNLPMSSVRNSGVKQAFDTWAAKCSRLATYDYALLHTDVWQPERSLPVPLVAGTVERAKYLGQLGALDGGCQATLGSLPYNPWNFYAYPRIRWNVNQTAGQIEQEFFNGYFRETAQPMMAYYQALENYQVTNDVSLHYMGYCYSITPGSFPLNVLSAMQTQLLSAEQTATNWFVVGRVAKIREGFDWVIAQRGLRGVDLTDISPYPAVPTGTVYSVNLATMTALTNRPSGNYAYWSSATLSWGFLAQGTIQTTLNMQGAGPYKVVINARAVPYQNVYPILDVYLGSGKGSAAITTTNYADYTFSVSVPSGAQDLVLDYMNSAEGGRRNIYVDSIRIQPQ